MHVVHACPGSMCEWGLFTAGSGAAVSVDCISSHTHRDTWCDTPLRLDLRYSL